MKPPTQLADEMLASVQARSAAIMAEREHILEAFIAKYGCHPDQCQQVMEGNKWYVIQIRPETVRLVRERIISAQYYRQGPSKWQRFCLWMARLK